MALDGATVPTSPGVAGRLAAAGTGVAVAGVAWPSLVDATGLVLPCPLRATTGIPCPLCGMTTATVALVRGRVGDALAANPLVLVVAVVTVVAAVAAARRWAGRRPPGWARPVDGRWAGVAAAGAIAGSWVWQLQRAGIVG